MKFRNKIITIVLAVCIITSCKKYLDVNEDPNNALDVPPKTLLPNTTVSMAFANSNELGKAAGLLMQYNAGIAVSVASAYDQWNLSGFDEQWSDEIYNGALNNLDILL